jgi:hypothetical protein
MGASGKEKDRSEEEEPVETFLGDRPNQQMLVADPRGGRCPSAGELIHIKGDETLKGGSLR